MRFWNLKCLLFAAYIKKEFDKKYNPTWYCIVGRNFGSYVTYKTLKYVSLWRLQFIQVSFCHFLQIMFAFRRFKSDLKSVFVCWKLTKFGSFLYLNSFLISCTVFEIFASRFWQIFFLKILLEFCFFRESFDFFREIAYFSCEITCFLFSLFFSSTWVDTVKKISAISIPIPTWGIVVLGFTLSLLLIFTLGLVFSKKFREITRTFCVNLVTCFGTLHSVLGRISELELVVGVRNSRKIHGAR